jgi:hypothetical protein
LKVLKCGAGEGWGRSVGPIMWKIKEYYDESGGREFATYKKKKEG